MTRAGRVGLLILWVAAFAAGTTLWIISAAAEPARAWRAVLVNFLFFSPIAAGMVAWSAVLLTSKARWLDAIERTALGGVAFALPSLALLAGLWISSPAWAPWAQSGFAWRPKLGAWMDDSFLFGRDLGVLIVLWALAAWYVHRRRRGEGRVAGPLLVVTYCGAFTLIAVDLVMAMTEHWYSSLLGAYFFCSGMYGAVVALAFMTALRPGADRDVLHDLGRLVLAFSLLVTYMMYCQLLPIWYENLPNEASFVVRRYNYHPWGWVSFGLLFSIYLGPLVYLITAKAKRTPAILAPVTFVLLLGLWVERWWLIAPNFAKGPSLGLPEISSAIAVLGVFGLTAAWPRRRPDRAEGTEGAEAKSGSDGGAARR